MRSIPVDLSEAQIENELLAGWGLRAGLIEFVPEGGGAYHWRVDDDAGGTHFVTVDDLDGKPWFGSERAQVFEGLQAAMSTSAALRHEVGLEFVVAPVAAGDGDLVRRLDDRYSVSVFPFLSGRAHPFGPYADRQLRDQVLDMVAALHRSTPAVVDRAPHHTLGYGGRADLEAFLAEPARPWTGGPFAEPARQLLAGRAAELAQLVAGLDDLAERTSAACADTVITHGEPHPANVMSLGSRAVLLDWDTAALAPAERDLSLVATATDRSLARYERATGRQVRPAVVTLYRLRWYLDDLGSAVQLFRQPHAENADTRRWWAFLAPNLDQLAEWLRRLE